MRIGIETECLTRVRTGVGYCTRSLIEGLLELQQNVVCFHTDTSAHPPIPAVEHFLFGKNLPIPHYHILANVFRTKCFNTVDILHFAYPKLLYVKKPKTPFVLTINDVIPLIEPKFFPKKTQFLMKYLLPKFLQDAKAIVAISHTTKHDLLHYFKIPEKKIHVIYPALLPTKSKLCLDKEPFFLYVGSFEPRKNLFGLLQAFAIVKALGHNYKLVLVGKEDKKNKIPWDLIKKLKIENAIVSKGFVSEEEKATLFTKATLFLWPSFYEGFGLPLLEAMSFGTPIVTTGFGAPQEIVGTAAILVNPSDPESIAAGILKIVSSQECAKALITKGLERAKDFSLQKTANAHIRLYTNVLDNCSSH